MSIEKLARDPGRQARSLREFSNGRSAFKAILASLDWPAGRTLLLPAYIGWSAREGSGVFDPVSELGLPFAFYRITPRLEIDLPDLAAQLAAHPRAVLLLIHYFGRVDPAYRLIARAAAETKAEVVEDEAHALLTDLVGGRSGRAGRHSFVSFHKMLPVAGGGAWVLNGPAGGAEPTGAPVLQRFDLAGISEVRRRNYARLLELLRPLGDRLEPLWPALAAGEVPQTFPVVLRRTGGGRAYRDEVYARMNGRGFGVVSLYHTLIDELDAGRYPASHALSRCILNLPVHQDAEDDQLRELVRTLGEVLAELEPSDG